MGLKRVIPGVIIFLLFLSATLQAQQFSSDGSNTTYLQLKECAFEQDAKAMVLTDEADISANGNSVSITRHKRIKLFKNYDHELATVHLPYYNKMEDISGIEAKTLKLQDGQVIATPIDPKLIYKVDIDKVRKEFVFTFPAIADDCIIEYQYHWRSYSPFDMPDWFFQSTIPVAYSKVQLTIANNINYNIIEKGDLPFAIKSATPNTNGSYTEIIHTWAKANLHSVTPEPYSSRDNNNLQCINFQYNYRLMNSALRVSNQPITTWSGVAYTLYTDDNIANELNQSISEQKDIIASAKALSTIDAQIAFLFNTVKQSIKWNGVDRWYVNEGVKKAWLQKTGNSTEINLLLINLLKKVNINANVLFVCTPDNGWADPNHADISQINKVVAYVTVDSTHNYVLDASDKYNNYDDVPASLLNSYGLYCSNGQLKGDIFYKMVLLKNERPALQSVLINAEVLPDGKVTGTTTLTSYSYYKSQNLRLYSELSTDEYIKKLKRANNRLSITDVNVENDKVDSLPLIQKFKFSLVQEVDNDAIYFKTNLFDPSNTNPFLSANRYTDIDFGNCSVYRVYCTYKLPDSYHVDLTPKNIQLSVLDKSIVFKRVVDIHDNTLTVSYSMALNRATYQVGEYTALHDFYKKIFEYLNEPVVLKKM